MRGAFALRFVVWIVADIQIVIPAKVGIRAVV